MGFYELAEKALALERSGKKLIRLNVGDTNLPTPPAAIETAAECMRTIKSSYGSSAGLQALREKIAKRENCGVENVVVGSGSKQILYALMSVLCKAGDTLALPTPYWPAYPLAAKQLGIRVHEMATTLEGGWEFGAVPKANMLIICNPLNPTSTIYPEKKVREAIEAAAKGGTHVILDEAYRGLAFSPMMGCDDTPAIRVRSFSKEFNMEGWRLGYAVAPADIVKKMVSFNQITTTCVPEFVQRAGIACLEDEKNIVEQNRSAWKTRSDAMAGAMKKAGFRFAQPQAGIYIFATHAELTDADSYALRLLDNGVAVSPGSGFGPHNAFFRVCVNQSEEKLKEAAEKMADALR